MATGYITGSTIKATPGGHTNTAKLFYGPNDTWWAVVLDSDADYWIFEWDGTIPASAGDTGGWALADNSAGGNVELHDRSSDAPTVAYDPTNEVLHVFGQRSSAQEYCKVSYNSGSNDWTVVVLREALSVNVGGNGGLGVDTNGIPWIVYIDGSTLNIETYYRDTDDTWKAGATIAAGAGSLATQRVSPVFRWKNGGSDYLGCIYSKDDATEKLVFAYRADSDAKSASWSTVTIDDDTGDYTADDHVSVAVGNFGSDTTSTIIVAAKKGIGGGYVSYRRSPAGSWSAANDFTGAGFTAPSRIKIAMDETNEEVYAFCVESTQVSYSKSTASGTLSWGSKVKVIEDTGANTFYDTAITPEPVGYNSDSDLIVMAGITATDKTWWNVIDLAGGGVTIPSAVKSFALTATSPTVSTGVIVTTPAKAFALSLPSVVVGTGINIVAPSKAFGLTATAPAVAAGASVSVPAQSYSLTVTPPAITAIDSGIQVNSPTKVFSLTAVVPAVSTGVSVAVPTKAYGLTDTAPVVGTGAFAAVPAKAFARALTAPTIDAGVNTIVSVPSNAFGITTTPPAILTGVSVGVPPKGFSLQKVAPAIGTGVIITIPAKVFEMTATSPEFSNPETFILAAKQEYSLTVAPYKGTLTAASFGGTSQGR